MTGLACIVSDSLVIFSITETLVIRSIPDCDRNGIGTSYTPQTCLHIITGTSMNVSNQLSLKKSPNTMTMTQTGDEENVTVELVLVWRSLDQEVTSLFVHCG